MKVILKYPVRLLDYQDKSGKIMPGLSNQIASLYPDRKRKFTGLNSIKEEVYVEVFDE